MGAGIAQIAAQAGHSVIVYDSFEAALETGATRIVKGAKALLERGKIDAVESEALSERIQWSGDIADLAPCGLIIEAIIEDRAIKTNLFKQIEEITVAETILATNTSSLSVSSLASGLLRPHNFIGLHFFNPAPIMKLVEVISGLRSDPAVVAASFDLMESWDKQVVTAKDVPGFIVNRVARPFYGEGWQAFEEKIADAATLDFLYRDLAGFRMGPMELGDLIGHDINSKAARSVYESYFGRTRFRPSLMQGQLAESGLLGRKSGQGVYKYGGDTKTPIVHYQDEAEATNIIWGRGVTGFAISFVKLDIDESLPYGFWLVDGVMVGFSTGASAKVMSISYGKPVAILDWVTNFDKSQSLAYSVSDANADKPARALITVLGKKAVLIADRPGAVVFRTILQLVNSATDAIRDNVATGDAIDKALQFGVNYPFGPMKWAKEFGVERVVKALDCIAEETGECSFYAPNHILRAMT